MIEALQQYRGIHYLDKDSSPSFRWVAMLPENPDEMEQDMLYVCMLSEALARNSKTPGYYYLSIRDRFIDDDEDIEARNGVIVINENKSAAWLLNLVQKRFLEISEWTTRMQVALVDNCDYQRLTDLSEPIFNNFMIMFDSSYTLVAYTKNIKCYDPINVAAIEKGYHSYESLQKFRDRKRFEVYEQEHGAVVSAPGVISRYEILTKWCRYGGELLLQVVMECSKVPLSPAVVDLFNIFMEYVQFCFLRQQRANPSQIYSSLLSDMLYGSLDNPFHIGERAKSADVPFSGLFDTYRIVFEDNSTILVGRFVQELLVFLPESKIIAHKYEVVVLNIHDSSISYKQALSNLIKLVPLLEKYGAMCGVSEWFATLPEFKNAYLQATRAQTLGEQLRTLGNSWNFDKEVYESTAIERSSNIFYYNDVYIHLALHFAQSGPFDAFANTLYNRMLAKLMEYDRENNTRLVQVLYAYLTSERRATTAGRLLGTHRNNILYHVSHIEEITGIDLNDYWTRLKLMLAFHFFEVKQSGRIFYTPGGDASES